ncbi:galactosyltransferase-related protein [Paenibacillus sp. GbtcB18]|uniref:galactosyltransferase-related protein n=1 Tax=Paenibacillus sp. GbtcB18 TaxID=2824763 RepID=UPI001C2F2814|nr:galactosyltransferase-related protein [Paenibacillus sp. GbtcB18]
MENFYAFSDSIPDERETHYHNANDDIMTLNAPWNVFWTGNISLSRKTIQNAGCLDEGFQGWGGEDTEWGYWIYKSNAKIALGRKAWGVHHPHEINLSSRSQTADHNLRNIIKKFPNLDCELYCRYYEVWKFYYDKMTHLNVEELTEQEVKQIKQFIRAMYYSNVLVVHGETFSDLPQVSTIVETNRQSYIQLCSKGKNTYHLSGCYLPFDNNSYELAVILPAWRSFDFDHKKNVVEEALRCAHMTNLIIREDPSPFLPYFEQLNQTHRWKCEQLENSSCSVIQISRC